MKKFFSLFLIASVLFCSSSQAQLVKSVSPAKATLTNADTTTISFGNVENDVTSFQAVFTRASGTAAGRVVLQGTIDGTNYLGIDSLAFTNIVTNSKIFNANTLRCAAYRFIVFTSGTVTGSLAGYKLRRSTAQF